MGGGETEVVVSRSDRVRSISVE